MSNESKDKLVAEVVEQTIEKEIDKAMIGDGLENLVSGMGGENDKSIYNRWVHSGQNQDHAQLAARFREDWISQKVCTIIPQDMTRQWRHIDTEEGIMADDEWEIQDKFREAYKWARLYGTSFLVLDVKGSGSLSKPLNIDKLKKGCIRSLQVIDRTRMHAMGTIDTEPMSPTFGMPTHYQFVNSAQKIHSSRLIRFDATELPLYENMRNQWYSDSALIPLTDVTNNFHTAAKSAAQLCAEACMDVVSIDGLQNLLTNPQGEQAVMKRFRVMKQLKSVYNVLLLDNSEEYNTKNVALNGVKDLIWEYLRIIAAAVGVPATRFLSASPDGMNATGESDLNNYIEFLEGLQRSVFKPKLKIVDALLQKHYGIAPYKYKFNCIFPESALQKADRERMTVEPLVALVTAGIMRPEVALKVLEDKRLYDGIELGTPPPLPPPTTGNKDA